ncbi:MAG: hypothetical protein A2149_01330 [Candidatus Schekmanbacteria bacterium RBG_16_38_11]|uniref:4Fe-4S ferredoxin-type domain-containing protein n=2 Tax=Candidatus Schekmaniibacteriota TaxID=1817811 RepID=A0A1F7RMK1_9BACT|nr:MAG: hypothetical protein A2042_05155 [Candidatus Schekmanbacteria bacterium GWA2_38_11]OGL46147.1 MAG: hypothetical protein A2149_01330 [Candidatus Schekmanbacteria bacterium RBG_16_38_11]
MLHRRLGRTNLQISCIAFGGLPSTFIPPKEAIEVITAAIDEGMNYFDLDEGPGQFYDKAYLDSHNKIGKVLKTRRNEVYLGVKTMRKKKNEVLEDIKKSHELLVKGTSREIIDIFQLAFVDYDHDIKAITSPDGAIAALEEGKKQGLIKHTLVAGHNRDILIDAIKTNAFDVVEFPFNIIEREVIDELIPIANKMEIGTIIMKPLGGGQFGEVAAAQIKWILEKPISCIIPGIKTVEEVKINAAFGKTPQKLTDAERKQLEAFSNRMAKIYCHRCGYCLPCSQGIKIFGLIDILHAGVLSYEKKKAAYLQAVQKGLLVPASKCIECGECVPKCPYELPIPELMKQLVEKFGI